MIAISILGGFQNSILGGFCEGLFQEGVDLIARIFDHYFKTYISWKFLLRKFFSFMWITAHSETEIWNKLMRQGGQQ